jgi:ribulose-phosphate 3-epimerase
LYCFHIEALSSNHEIEKLISHIKSKNMKVGIAIKPKTPSSVLYPWISHIDMALVMVRPLPSSPLLPFRACQRSC